MQVRREAGLLTAATVVMAMVALPLAPAASARRVHGSAKADRLTGTRAADLIRSGRGNDRVSGGRGSDRLYGGSGGDRLSGGSGNDALSGDSGNDRLSGGSGRDRLSGGSGNDALSGDSGNDRLSGGSGRDRLGCGSGRDVAVAGRGDRIARDCERIVDSRGRRVGRALDIEGAVPPGSNPPGKTCHTEIRTVLVQKGTGIHAPFVLEPQVVLICGGKPGGGPPQCSDGRDNDGDLAVDFPQDRGCSSASDDREYPDPVNPVEQLLTSRNGFWYVLPDNRPGGSPSCSLYVFRTTPQGDRIGSRQDWFPNIFTGQCLLQTTSGVPQTYTWSTSDFPLPAVIAPYTAMGTQVRLQYTSGTVVLLWIFARDASRDLLVYTVNRKPGETSPIGLWGCSSPNFPQVLKPPGC